mgnify:CR=1 FL=1
MSDGAQWYVVHTYSGYENTVKATIEKYVENRGLQDLIHEISIPLETVTEITDNGPKEVERKVFPGYVLVKMVMNDETWHVVRNIRGVTGFLGEGNKAIPLSDADVAALGVEKREIVVSYQVGDTVKITDGAKRRLAAMGYEPRYGVRSLKRTLLDNVEEPLSTLIIEGRVNEGAKVKILPAKAGVTLKVA